MNPHQHSDWGRQAMERHQKWLREQNDQRRRQQQQWAQQQWQRDQMARQSWWQRQQKNQVGPLPKPGGCARLMSCLGTLIGWAIFIGIVALVISIVIHR